MRGSVVPNERVRDTMRGVDHRDGFLGRKAGG